MRRFLCRFDFAGKTCFATALENETPNVGVVVGSSYYYAKNPGSNEDVAFYWVEDIDTDVPTFSTAVSVYVSSAFFVGAVLDVVALDESDGHTYIDDDAELTYLVGIGKGYEVFVLRLDSDGQPEAYAVLGSNVDWGTTTEETGDTEGFGAAYLYGK